MDWTQAAGAVIIGIGVVAFSTVAADQIDWHERRLLGAATIVGLLLVALIVGFLFDPRWVGY